MLLSFAQGLGWNQLLCVITKLPTSFPWPASKVWFFHVLPPLEINYVPVSSWTMAKEGSKRVEMTGSDDKRQITAVFGGTMAANYLPPQLIYQGKTSKYLPSALWTGILPSQKTTGWVKGQWSKIFFPYIEKKRLELKLDINYPALVRFRGQCTENIFALLEAKHVLVTVVPANCTDQLQPLDVSINKVTKNFFAASFRSGTQSRYVCQQLPNGNDSAL